VLRYTTAEPISMSFANVEKVLGFYKIFDKLCADGTGIRWREATESAGGFG